MEITMIIVKKLCFMSLPPQKVKNLFFIFALEDKEGVFSILSFKNLVQ